MGIGLVPDIEDNLVRRSVIDIMHTYDKLDSSQARTKMARIYGTTFHHIMANLATELPELSDSQIPYISRSIDLIK